MDDIRFTIQFENHLPISGDDTAIANLPNTKGILDLPEALAIIMLTKTAVGVARESAAMMKPPERLHHADIVVTSKPETVAIVGIAHDCPQCHEGVKRALDFMKEKPDATMICAHLYWASPNAMEN